jgi:DNA-binding transcriptional regulator YdaS (Cro superfamily)
MDLRSYRAKYGRGALPALARRAHVHSSRLYEIVRGHVPTAKIAKQIEAATEGEVTAAEVLGLTTPASSDTAPGGEHDPNDRRAHPSDAPDAAAE